MIDPTDASDNVEPTTGAPVSIKPARPPLPSDVADDAESSSARVEQIARLTRQLLLVLGEDPDREGLLKTPERVGKAWLEMTAGYRQNLENVVNGALFDLDDKVEEHPVDDHGGRVQDETMVVVSDIAVSSLCEHHLLPFTGRVHVGLLVRRRVLGLSKIPKICEMFAKRLQVQERLTQDIGRAVRRAFSVVPLSASGHQVRINSTPGTTVGSEDHESSCQSLGEESVCTPCEVDANATAAAFEVEMELESAGSASPQGVSPLERTTTSTGGAHGASANRNYTTTTATTSSSTSPATVNEEDCLGVAVLFTNAVHHCMCSRGAKSVTSRTSTSFYSGLFETQPHRRAEFLTQIQLNKKC